MSDLTPAQITALAKEAKELASKATPGPWQKSYFVDKREYSKWTQSQKAEAMRTESMAVRGPGRVGDGACNPVLRFEYVHPEDKELCIRARELVPALADLVLSLQAENESRQWISVGERPPEDGQRVLVCAPDDSWAPVTDAATYCAKDALWQNYNWHRDVPASERPLWMPMPAAPGATK